MNLTLHRLAGLAGFLGLTLLAVKGATPLFEEGVVWSRNEGNFPVHHAYGLTVTPKGTVLAFTEARIDPSDAGPHSLVMKRSTDLGRTWTANMVIEVADGSFWRAHGQPGKLEAWANAGMLAERQSGRVFIFYALNEGLVDGKNAQRYTRVFYRTSDDEGVTWTDRTEVTDLLNVKADGSPNLDEHGRQVVDANGFPCDYLGRAFHMPGPGHGIQLKNGRMLLQFWNRTAIGAESGLTAAKDRRYGLSLLYSDDGGKTWHGGPAVGHELAEIAGANESRLAQLDNGDIYWNARGQGQGAYHRWVFLSSDNGLHWRTVGADAEMPPYIPVDSGLTTIRQNDRQILLLSHPRPTEWRTEMTVSASLDGGRTWQMHKTLNGDGGTYSDLVTLPDGTVGLLYGKGWNDVRYTPRNSMSATVVFARFNLGWLGLEPINSVGQ